MKNIVAIIAIFIVVGLAIGYIIRSKKKGIKCIGCPSAGNCNKCTQCNNKIYK